MSTTLYPPSKISSFTSTSIPSRTLPDPPVRSKPPYSPGSVGSQVATHYTTCVRSGPLRYVNNILRSQWGAQSATGQNWRRLYILYLESTHHQHEYLVSQSQQLLTKISMNDAAVLGGHDPLLGCNFKIAKPTLEQKCWMVQLVISDRKSVV